MRLFLGRLSGLSQTAEELCQADGLFGPDSAASLAYPCLPAKTVANMAAGGQMAAGNMGHGLER